MPSSRGEDPVDGKDLLEPADVLPVPAFVRRIVRGRKADGDPADGFALHRREHLVGKPTEPLFVSADHPDAGLGGACLPKRGIELRFEPLPELRGLADQHFELHPVPWANPRNHLAGEALAEFFDFPAEVRFLVEHGHRSVA